MFPADVTRRSFLALGNAAETGVHEGGLENNPIICYC